MTAGQFDTLDIGLLYMQVLAIVFSFATSYTDHSVFYNEVVNIFNLVNFDVRTLPACALVRVCVCLGRLSVCVRAVSGRFRDPIMYPAFWCLEVWLFVRSSINAAANSLHRYVL